VFLDGAKILSNHERVQSTSVPNLLFGVTTSVARLLVSSLPVRHKDLVGHSISLTGQVISNAPLSSGTENQPVPAALQHSTCSP
jgi:hypothetical protein